LTAMEIRERHLNKSKAKGTAGESQILGYLEDLGIDAHRLVLMGAEDQGDIYLEQPLDITIECKNEKKTTLSEYVNEANRESDNAKTWIGVAWHKRRGKGSPADWYVTMDGKTFGEILLALKYLLLQLENKSG